MVRTLPLVIALLLVIGAGLLHGRWTHRWSRSRALEDAAKQLDQLPLTLGDWHGEDLKLNREQLELGEIVGHVSRRYEDPLHHEALTVLIVCGRPGPIAAHTPDVCYAGAGFELCGPTERYSLPRSPSQPAAEFQNALMSRPGVPLPSVQRIYWSWSVDGRWQVPRNPRLAFGSQQVLYKLYVIRELSSTDLPVAEDPSPRFLRVLLPELNRLLFPRENHEGVPRRQPTAAAFLHRPEVRSHQALRRS